MATDDAAQRHRLRFVDELVRDRTVADADRPAAESPARAELVLALAARSEADAIAELPSLSARLAANGILVLAVSPPAAGALPDLLRQVFAHVTRTTQRPVTGSLFAAEPFLHSRVARLADAGEAAPDVEIFCCGNAPLPPLPVGLFEASASGPAVPAAMPAARPAVAEMDADRSRRGASLVGRLVELDEAILARDLEIGALQRDLDDARSQPGRGGGWFDVPREPFEWPLAADPHRPVATLAKYERRVDDDVFAASSGGRAFMARWGLDGPRPNFAGAAGALAGGSPQMPLAAGAGDAPDVSIIIPVYGQLAYTLNCLDALFRHHTRARVEIIVVDDVSPDETGTILPLIPGIRVHRQARNGGFIASCNTGAAMARGRILVMLNNDTRVMTGWLDALVDSFALFPRAGLVGSKLLYPDGSLQEAGGIIWRDAAGWNYGRNDDPNRPQYSYARQVDYISGAAIALPAPLWRELGGFDPLYTPAYCEDTDLAFRVRAAGHEVWFQPQSRLIHYEGRTSGTDLSSGTKAYQLVNVRKFFVRWRETLAAHRPNGEAPFFERERGVRKRALLVDATCPTPKQDAGSVLTTLNMKMMQMLGYKAHFVPQDNFLFQPEHTAALLRSGIECAYAPYDRNFEDYVRRYGALFDVVLVFRVLVLEQVIDALRTHVPQAPILFHNVDLHYLRMQRAAEMEGDAAAAAAAAAMKTLELALIRRVDCTITPSSFEKQVLAEEVPHAPLVVLPFIFDFHGTETGFATRRHICFLGGYHHAPNIDAVTYFVREVFPLIRAAEPGIRFIIAGANPTPEVKALATEDVIVTGMIDDLREVFDAARVFVCPLRFGAGVKGKVAAAMSYGLPIVSTSIGTEGMDLVDGEQLLLADDPASFAAATLRLYRDQALWEFLSQAGMRLIRDAYSLASGCRVLEEAIELGFRHKLELAE